MRGFIIDTMQDKWNSKSETKTIRISNFKQFPQSINNRRDLGNFCPQITGVVKSHLNISTAHIIFVSIMGSGGSKRSYVMDVHAPF